MSNFCDHPDKHARMTWPAVKANRTGEIIVQDTGPSCRACLEKLWEALPDHARSGVTIHIVKQEPQP